MSKYNAAPLVKVLRERIGLEREAMLSFCKLDESSLRRIESEKQHPKPDTLESIMKSIDLPLEGFIYSLLEDQPMGVYLLCDRLTQLLDIGDTAAAEITLAQIEALPGFDTGIPHQFLLSKKARLWELLEKPPSQILSLIEAGMAETFENFSENDIIDSVLVLEEPELMHTKARVLAKSGELDAAVKILENMMSSLEKLPTADREKERLFAPVLLSLVKCLIKTGDYSRIPDICDIGSEYSAARKLGQLNPDFEFHKALALRRLNRNDECRILLQHAYFGYMLFGEVDRANEVLAKANEDFDIHFELYGVDKLGFTNHPRVPYNRGSSIDCDSIGAMISTLRKNANLSQEQLSYGICDKSTLSRIERNISQSQIFTMEAIMQRFGRDISLYHNFFLSKDDFIAMQLRDRIYKLMIEKNHNDASELLKELEIMDGFIKHSVNQQFIKIIKALIYEAAHDEPKSDFPDMLLDALKTTCPQFNENNIESYYLTYNELIIINRYASHFLNIDDLSRATDIYERILRHLDGKCVDEVVKARMYSTVLLNYSSALGKAGRVTEALAIVSKGESFERNHRRLIELPVSAFNKGYGMMVLGRKEESTPYFALAYYGTALFAKYGQATNLPIIRRTVKENLGMYFH